MTNFKSLTIWTIVLNFFIIVGAGHGIACIGMLEIGSIIVGLSGHTINDFSLSLVGSYENSLGAVSLFSLTGQLFLILSIFVKGQKAFWTKILGILFLWTSFYYLIHNFFTDDLSRFGFLFGFPFLICSILLSYRIIKQNLQILSA